MRSSIYFDAVMVFVTSQTLFFQIGSGHTVGDCPSVPTALLNSPDANHNIFPLPQLLLINHQIDHERLVGRGKILGRVLEAGENCPGPLGEGLAAFSVQEVRASIIIDRQTQRVGIPGHQAVRIRALKEYTTDADDLGHDLNPLLNALTA